MYVLLLHLLNAHLHITYRSYELEGILLTGGNPKLKFWLPVVTTGKVTVTVRAVLLKTANTVSSNSISFVQILGAWLVIVVQSDDPPEYGTVLAVLPYYTPKKTTEGSSRC